MENLTGGFPQLELKGLHLTLAVEVFANNDHSPVIFIILRVQKSSRVFLTAVVVF